MVAYAHSANTAGEWHRLEDHLRAVAQLAREFGEPLGLGEESYWAGLLHDIGKLEPDFQRRLRGEPISAPHAAYGACIAADAGAVEVALAVAAHHTGLDTGHKLQSVRSDRPPLHPDGPDYATRARLIRQEAQALLPELAESPPRTALERDPRAREEFDLRTRFILSCLVDADRLDTEAHFQPEASASRAREFPSMEALAVRVERYIDELQVGAAPNAVNDARREVLAACVSAAAGPSCLATLTVPTGGGKTLASLLYALRHAAANGLRRVIVVVPFLAIIEQNARVIRLALADQAGPDSEAPLVLEHHSAIIGDHSDGHGDGAAQGGQQIWRRLGIENWDAPIIITTAVQFLESLFTAHPSRARKLHRVAQSAVVFDEVQTLPPRLLAPILSMLRQLNERVGVSFLFCTATQPAFEQQTDGPGPRWPAGTMREIMPEPDRVFAALDRVKVQWPREDERRTWPDLASALVREERALAIVNTKRQARDLYEAVRLAAREAGTRTPIVHLSAHMCPRHRSAALRRVRGLLASGKPCVVVATQLVEAGVDLDFPAVYRAFGPLDAIAQAAGRCNREGRLVDGGGSAVPGRVVVFRPEDNTLPGDTYCTATDVTASMLAYAGGALDISDPALFRQYFDRLYTVSDLDPAGVIEARQKLEFSRVEQEMRLIDNDDTQAVIMPWGKGQQLIDRISRGEVLDRALTRRLQPFGVNLYRTEFQKALRAGALEPLADGAIYAAYAANYDRDLGFVSDADPSDYLV